MRVVLTVIIAIVIGALPLLVRIYFVRKKRKENEERVERIRKKRHDYFRKIL